MILSGDEISRVNTLLLKLLIYNWKRAISSLKDVMGALLTNNKLYLLCFSIVLNTAPNFLSIHQIKALKALYQLLLVTN